VQAHWPEHPPSAYCTDLERAIGHALIDSLAAAYYPYRGCAVTLIDVGWDDVMGSEMAFYHATRGPMDELRSKASWKLVPL
jgi:hypothetical protein